MDPKLSPESMIREGTATGGSAVAPGGVTCTSSGPVVGTPVTATPAGSGLGPSTSSPSGWLMSAPRLSAPGNAAITVLVPGNPSFGPIPRMPSMGTPAKLFAKAVDELAVRTSTAVGAVTGPFVPKPTVVSMVLKFTVTDTLGPEKVTEPVKTEGRFPGANWFSITRPLDPVSSSTGTGGPPSMETSTIGKGPDVVSGMPAFSGIGVPAVPALPPGPVPAPPVPPVPLVPGVP